MAASGVDRSAAGDAKPLLQEMPMLATANGSQPLARLVFLGDMSMGDAYLRHPQLAAEYRRLEEDPWSFIEGLAPLVADRSILVANLETVLAEAPVDPFGGKKKYQGWDKPDRTLSILKRLQVDAVSLANNHTMDFGPAALLSTIDHLSTAGIRAFGAGADAVEALRPVSFTSPFGNIHIFAGFEFRATYARRFDYYASGRGPGVSPLTHPTADFVADAVGRTRAEDPGAIIIVYAHWCGPINYGWANEEMLALNETLLAKGADLMIGHGAHRMQEVQSVPQGTTVYSLGNFVFNSLGSYRKYDAPPYSLLARLDLADGGSGCAGRLRLYPIVSDNRSTGFRPRPVTESEAIAVEAELRARESIGLFEAAFTLCQDSLGWCLESSRPLSPRISHLSTEGDRQALGH